MVLYISILYYPLNYAKFDFFIQYQFTLLHFYLIYSILHMNIYYYFYAHNNIIIHFNLFIYDFLSIYHIFILKSHYKQNQYYPLKNLKFIFKLNFNYE